jgi:hypothetical protein
MATYKEIRGTTVQNNAGNLPSAVDGQLWYNSTAGSFQVRSFTTAGAWATGGTLNTARYSTGSAGIQTAALAFGGITVPPVTALTESYNGTSWTEVNDLNTARTLGNAGTQTSALGFGGSPGPTAITESWNGTSWTEVNDLNSARRNLGGAGADNTSALAFGGEDPGAVRIANTETWNGTSWTEVNDLNTARNELTGAGIQTAAIAPGGRTPLGRVAITETWNGTSWTEVADLNTARSIMGNAGTYTSTLAFGGYDGTDSTAVTEEWNGTSWTETTDLNVGRYGPGGVGTQASALAFGGIKNDTPNVANETEEWTGAGAPVTETITTS